MLFIDLQPLAILCLVALAQQKCADVLGKRSDYRMSPSLRLIKYSASKH
jgi:hypothetical protein